MKEADRTALEARLAAMADQDVTRLYEEQEPGSEEADNIAGEMERRNLDD